ncbi:PROBABLE TETRONASIN-TRANSPORT INTEGRAL MEMBRANE PROTEIN ABC TRANSPORTER [[Actinomadura] parvosata subsp. kistnae]|uniref:Uncharacterized protein n=1 Tax=[Actinomadura] parvosata subsp. kistnae TaxID=1909395 RepID=A0A1U9ZW07_9ACTN|nr:hypothetical protein [Nonomuraea sp. ATCC 55076]AQZ62117.1 hypothetical protein BKM31_12110 [Nonomuraea sp. ATCC 55076]SPL95854.1 PROBABLE TETRONASIN-TRANSPORT INTEGRAL MEMBRANE PROTEIN ABC TRANSPORTER [Actinomadura parvosata subsp. kistnae]
MLGLFPAVDLLAEVRPADGIVPELSPFVHVPALPLNGTAAAPALALALAAAGPAFLRRRDLALSA